jgi:GNAT superfamily N-acetyltransferase
MSSTSPALDPRLRRGLRWRDAIEAAVCDVVRDWEHGTILRASRYPTYYRFNFVRIAGDPGLGAADLAHVADQALGDLEHRRLDFDSAAAAEAVRGELHAAGWKSMRSILMRHEGAAPAAPAAPVVPVAPAAPAAPVAPAAPAVELEEVAYDAVNPLRAAWHAEDFPDAESEQYEIAAREVAMSHGARVFAVWRDGRPIAFAQLETTSRAAEVAQVYVLPAHRGAGLGTAITTAAIEAAGEVEDLWIRADDEDRPKQLYARLGFQPVWATTEFLLLP